jgi:predicted nuclease with RNAse H fold
MGGGFGSGMRAITEGRDLATSKHRAGIVVGIDVAEERKGLDLVALDRDRRVIASAGHLTVEDVRRLVLEELRPDMVCIDSPSSWSISGKSRGSERELRKLGITAFST